MTEKETIEEAILRVTKQRLTECREDYKELRAEINWNIERLQKHMDGEAWYTSTIAFEINQLTSDYAIVYEKIKGLEREVELLEIIEKRLKV